MLSPRQDKGALTVEAHDPMQTHALQVDLHTPNLEAATLDWQGQGTSSLFFLPGNMETADAQLTAEGRWLFRCRVADHVGAGMEVLPAACLLLAQLLVTGCTNS
jgi:uncharacterized cupredoxin-like copper-binding protein